MSSLKRWQGAKIVFFDCDSTLSKIEGIDELALRKGVDVSDLTARAMRGELPLEEVYAERLRLISPSAEDFPWLAERYMQELVPGAKEVVSALNALDIKVAILSGGLLPGVLPFAVELGVAADDVFAVPFPVDLPVEEAIKIACAHPLSRNGGKPELIAEFANSLGIEKSQRMLVGDGASDLEASSELGLFVGFGGVETRAQVEAEAEVFLKGPGLWSVAHLASGDGRLAQLGKLAPRVYEYGVSDA